MENRDSTTNKHNLNMTNKYLGNSPYQEFYDMNHKYRGMAIIFNHEFFEIDLTPRTGTAVDCQNLERVLSELGFTVEVFRNLKYKEILKQIKVLANMDYSEHDCLLIVVLSHGESGVLYAKDMHYKSQQIWCDFTEKNCPSLTGKPKLFIFQACQGDNYDDGITLANNIETDGWFSPHRMPSFPDFLVMLSTVPGYYSWRNTERGSWFIMALCEELSESAFDTDILTLLTRVSHKVALDFESYTPRNLASHEKKQVPSISTMLTRRLVLTKKLNNNLIQREEKFYSKFKAFFSNILK